MSDNDIGVEIAPSGRRIGLPHHTRLTMAVRGTPVTVAASSSDGDVDELALNETRMQLAD